MQVGIVDCAPRFLKKAELYTIRSFGKLGGKIISILNNNKVRNFRNITYVPFRKFHENICIIEDFFNAKVYFLEIIKADLAYEKIAPGITSNIEKYNSVLKNMRNYISLFEIPKNGIMSDFHHLNSEGHMFIYNEIKNKLR